MFDSVVAPIVSLLNSILTPMLLIVGAVGALYCVVLGVKFAKAEEPQDREKAKGALKNAIIGFVLIFVLILALKLLMPIMVRWVNENGGNIALNFPTGKGPFCESAEKTLKQEKHIRELRRHFHAASVHYEEQDRFQRNILARIPGDDV